MENKICPSCGAKIDANYNFCDQCGFLLDTSIDDLKCEIRPQFNFAIRISPWTILLGTLLVIVIKDFNEDMRVLSPETLLIGNIIVGFIVLMYIWYCIKNYLKLKNQVYIITNEKIIYKSNFLVKELREIKVESIQQLSINQNIFERVFNYGKLIITTNNYSDNLVLDYIKTPEEKAGQ